MKIKKGDQVLVTKGKDKGRKGKVVKILSKTNKIIVDGLNLKKKHVKPKKSGEKGQIIEMSFPFSVSNVKFWCAVCQKGVRINYKIDKDKKYRICQKCKKSI
ncbi:MAG: 50S ribosomal protein L24 [Candidatus Pacebacteria bacterium]|nr:50S ribosomal protein L24 [Candidatus Paceibacterota bacterium]